MTFLKNTITSVPRTTDQEISRYLQSIKRAFDEFNQRYTVSSEGIVSLKRSNASNDAQNSTGSSGAASTIIISGGGGVDLNLGDTRQPAPVTFTSSGVTGLVDSVVLQWTHPTPESTIASYNIYRANNQNMTNYQLVGSTTTYMFADIVGANQTNFYVVTAVSTGGVESNWSSALGVEGATLADPLASLIQASNGVTQSHLNTSLLNNLPTLAGVKDSSGADNFAPSSVTARVTASEGEITTIKNTTLPNAITQEVTDRNTAIANATVNLDLSTNTDFIAMNTKVNNNFDGLIAETNQKDQAVASINGQIALIQTEQATQATDIQSETANRIFQFNTLENSISSVESSAATAATASQAATNLVNTSISQMNNDVAQVQTDISTLTTNTQTTTNTLNTQISILNGNVASADSQITTLVSDVASEVNNRQSQFASIEGNVSNVEATVNNYVSDTDSKINAVETSTASFSGSLATIENSLTATVNANSNEINQLLSTTATLTGSLASLTSSTTVSLDNLSTRIDTSDSLVTQFGNSVNTLTDQYTSVTTDLAAAQASVTTFSSSLNNVTSTLDATIGTHVNSLGLDAGAIYEIKTNVDGNVAGFGLINDNTNGSQFTIEADRFAVVVPPSSMGTNTSVTDATVHPFVIAQDQDPASSTYGKTKTWINGATIKDATLTGRSVVQGTLGADHITLTGGLSALSANLGSITSGVISDVDLTLAGASPTLKITLNQTQPMIEIFDPTTDQIRVRLGKLA